ncbi:LysR family transcriptional regulator ArgP [Zavarzinia compransoris]|uniref:ArgP/LysG family DNA-binding transcriptional regulator n=1 Tax=Zavarzinia compransoris TaxID=1264899 RepID=A0A317E414_9PROT|nr:LysR family transcriptional regulator ArgP [Zavarzinia compransoris]PWR21858.1 ArgP/LysG family DNA-binding transcriptional regulator [Zavarzinia compransoris]TDP45337.1 LysR family transcriptional regulator (chromosome initiation inhibitor) [Zavarzinia compransoris]
MFDYPALQALAAVVRLGSFERAAQALNVTPSAVSQRVKQLEERWGAVLVVRGQPCAATAAGRHLCRHVEQVGLLEAGLARHLPGAGAPAPLTLPVAVNADSLGTWFIAAAARFAADSGHLLDLTVDDQDHTAERLRRGEVLAAVTGHGRAVQGCRVTALGRLRYRITASPAFMARHFPAGVTAAAMARAPALTFDRKDQLQRHWLALQFGLDQAGPTHWLPSTQGFVDACVAGMGWALNPEALVEDHLRAGRLVDLVPGAHLDVPLFWQVGHLAAKSLAGLTRAVTLAARARLVRD